MGKSDLLKDSMKSGLDGLLSSTKKSPQKKELHRLRQKKSLLYIAILLFIIRKSKFPQNPKRSVRFSGKRTKRSVQKRKARNTQKAETKVL